MRKYYALPTLVLMRLNTRARAINRREKYLYSPRARIKRKLPLVKDEMKSLQTLCLLCRGHACRSNKATGLFYLPAKFTKRKRKIFSYFSRKKNLQFLNAIFSRSHLSPQIFSRSGLKLKADLSPSDTNIPPPRSISAVRGKNLAHLAPMTYRGNENTGR